MKRSIHSLISISLTRRVPLVLSLLCLSAILPLQQTVQAQTTIKKNNPQARGFRYLMVDPTSSTGAGKTGLTGAAVGTSVNVVAGVAGSFTSITYTPNVLPIVTTGCSGTITEVKAGSYLYVPTSTESNTNYDVDFIAQATGAIDYEATVQFWNYKLDDLGMALIPTTGTIAAGSSGTSINTTLTAPNVNCYKGQVVVFTSGALVGQTHLIASNTTGASSVLSVLTAPAVNPAAGDTFSLVTGIGQKMVDLLTGTSGVLVATDSANQIASQGAVTTLLSRVPNTLPAFPANFNTLAVDTSGRLTLTPTEHALFAGDVFNATASSYNIAASLGQKLNSAGSAGNPWTTDISTGYTGTQAGALLYAIRAGQPVTLPTTAPSGYGGGLSGTQATQLATAAGYTFPTNFNLLAIDGAGKINFNNTNIATINSLLPPVNWNLQSIDGAGKVAFNNTSIGSVTGSVGSVTAPVTLPTTAPAGYGGGAGSDPWTTLLTSENTVGSYGAALKAFMAGAPSNWFTSSSFAAGTQAPSGFLANEYNALTLASRSLNSYQPPLNTIAHTQTTIYFVPGTSAAAAQAGTGTPLYTATVHYATDNKTILSITYN